MVVVGIGVSFGVRCGERSGREGEKGDCFEQHIRLGSVFKQVMEFVGRSRVGVEVAPEDIQMKSIGRSRGIGPAWAAELRLNWVLCRFLEDRSSGMNEYLSIDQ
jgi:hypothetical protein